MVTTWVSDIVCGHGGRTIRAVLVPGAITMTAPVEGLLEIA
jgi:hypothetical protein